MTTTDTAVCHAFFSCLAKRKNCRTYVVVQLIFTYHLMLSDSSCFFLCLFSGVVYFSENLPH